MPLDLYTDEEVRSIAGYDPSLLPAGEESYLDVVPSGETRALMDVLKLLGLDSARLREPRFHGANNTFSLAWQISPSYDFVCMTNFSGPDLFDSQREVYGVQIIKRSAGYGWSRWEGAKSLQVVSPE
jgi:hypothetical protein